LSGASTIGNARHSPASLASVRSGSVLVLLVRLTVENNATIQGRARPVVI